MSDEPALLAAILAHPDEDTPRLIYADWLQENGQPERAEFIRLQCAPDADEAAENRAFELEERHRVKWLTAFVAPQLPGARWEFRRGFPEELIVSVELLLERYSAFARVDWLRSLTLDGLDISTVRDFLNRGWNPHWVELELLGRIIPGLEILGDDSTPFVEAIADCSQARQLRRLRLSINPFEDDGISALVASPHLEHLDCIRIEGGRDDPRFNPLRERFGERLVIWG